MIQILISHAREDLHRPHPPRIEGVAMPVNRDLLIEGAEKDINSRSSHGTGIGLKNRRCGRRICGTGMEIIPE